MKKIILKNGLTLFLYQDKRRHSTFINFITNLGGNAQEYQYKEKKYKLRNGMAHLLEHLLIESSPYGNLMHTFEEMGMRTNGTTYMERTEYYFEGIAKIEEALEILLKGINTSVFTEEDTEKVKNAIYEEIRMGKDSKGRCLFALENKAIFQNYTYRNSIGEIEDVESFTYKEIKRCYDAFYHFKNQFLVIAGHFDEDAIIRKVEDICAELPVKEDLAKLIFPVEPKEVHEKYLTYKMPTGSTMVEILYKMDIKHLTSEERLALDFYMAYFFDMNFSNLTKLKNELALKKIIVGSIGLEKQVFKDTFIFGICAMTEKEVSFIKEVKKVLKNPILDETLFNELNREARIQIGLREENIHQYISPFTSNLFTFDYPYPDTVEQIDSYTFDKFKQAIGKLDFTNEAILKIEDIKREQKDL